MNVHVIRHATQAFAEVILAEGDAAAKRGVAVCYDCRNNSELFAREGEQGFRKRETAALRGLGRERSLLVSCGGGIVETPENILLMKEMGTCVYLDLDIEDSLRQICRSDTRPDFRSPEHAARLLEHRRPLYESAADLTVDIRGTSFEDVMYRVAELLLERGLL